WTVGKPWNWTFTEYNLIVESTSPVVAAEVDPFHRTPDFNRLNNHSSFPVNARLFQPPQPNADTYSIGYRPLIDFSETHGAGFGATARGRYIMNNHIAEAMVKFWPEVIADPRGETFVDGIDWHFGYSRLLGIPANGLRVQGSIDKHLGIVENRAGITKSFNKIVGQQRYEKIVSLTVGHQFRESDQGFNGVIEALPGRLWTSGNIMSALIEFVADGGLNSLRAAVEFGGPLDNPSDPSAAIFGSRASVITVEGGVGRTNGTFTGKISAAAEVGNNDLVFQKRRILGSAPLESQWRNPASRTLSSALFGQLEDIQFSPVSNRGPVAYLLGDYFNATPSGFGALTGSNLVSANASISAAKGPASAELFAGIGQVWDIVDEFETDRFLADAGLGVALDVASIPQLSRWVDQSSVLSNLQLTALFPVWASDPQRIDPTDDKFEFRWLLGVKVAN
ncbi:MAG: hypothetical protein HKN43_02180, partial [Rhodothermales bacterium]|nr:hypothetical protein [Rhodothermales bacterium]